MKIMKETNVENLSEDEKVMVISLLKLEPESRKLADLLIRRLKIMQDFQLPESDTGKEDLWLILTENLSIKIK